MKKVILSIILLGATALTSCGNTSATPEANSNIATTSSSPLKAQTTGYFTSWRQTSCYRVPFGTNSTWERDYMQLNPSNGQYYYRYTQYDSHGDAMLGGFYRCNPPAS